MNDKYEPFTIDEDAYSSQSASELEKLKTKKSITKIVLITIISVLLGQILLGGIALWGLHLYNPNFLGLGDGSQDAPIGKSIFDDDDEKVVQNIVVESDRPQIVEIAEKVGPSVVGIRVTARTNISWFFGDIPTESVPEGSGVIISDEGYILTNDHVIESALDGRTNNTTEGSKIEVLVHEKDELYKATVVGRDRRTDLAVLKIEAKEALSVINFGDSDEIRVGELAVAIGNPGGLEYMGSVTSGIVSGLNRTIPLEDGKELHLIQTDAAINPGNSGGALVNGNGDLIGVNAAKIGGSGYEGLGFAIPSNIVKEVTLSLMEHGYVTGRPLLGILVDPRYTPEVAERHDMPVGVLVEEVSLFTGAYNAGIKRMDIITKFDGESVSSVEELNEVRDRFSAGETVEAKIYRDGELLTIEITLSEDEGTF